MTATLLDTTGAIACSMPEVGSRGFAGIPCLASGHWGRLSTVRRRSGADALHWGVSSPSRVGDSQPDCVFIRRFSPLEDFSRTCGSVTGTMPMSRKAKVILILIPLGLVLL